MLLSIAVLSQPGLTRPAPERAPCSGLYAIWLNKANEDRILRQPYVAGGQVVAQWAEVEPQPGHYDFSTIAAQLHALALRHLHTTVQVNGNDKPDWLFERVPSLPQKFSHQIQDARGSLMFWHPAHQQAQIAMLKALGTFLATLPDSEWIAGIRMSPNALGTEHTAVPADFCSPDRWNFPAGVPRADLPSWNADTERRYYRGLVAAYLDAFGGHFRVFLRNGIANDVVAPFRPKFADGTLGWFHTSSEAEPRSSATEFRYRRFYDDARSGHTLAYAEPWASAWGQHGGKTDDRWCSPPQWNYWTVLLDLHCGVSCLAFYGEDLKVAIDGTYRHHGIDYRDGPTGHYREEFRAAYEFAARYAGCHASPATSPGAWVAFRENHTIRAANGLPPEKLRLDFFNNDYDFLAHRVPGDHSRGEGVVDQGPSDQRFGAWARILPAGDSIRVALDPAFAASLTAGAELRVTFLDAIDASDFQVSAAGETAPVATCGTARWQTATVPRSPSPDASGIAPEIAVTAGSHDLILHMVEVVRH